MKTIEDVILEHVEKYNRGEISSTLDAIKALELPEDHKHNGVGNMYLSSLAIILNLMKKVEDLEKQFAYWENK